MVADRTIIDLVSARAGTTDDVAVTATIASEAQTVARGERGGRWLLDHDVEQIPPAQNHRAAVEDPHELLAVGCIDHHVVGYGRAVLSPTTTGQICMIEELVVHPDARAIGVGSAILAEVRAWAVRESCQAIESQVLPGNRAAKNFFERVGMKTRKMRVSADL